MKLIRLKSVSICRPRLSNQRNKSTVESRGLLPENKNISESLFYSDNISFTKAYSLIKESNNFFDKFCVKNKKVGNLIDENIISEVIKSAETFIYSKVVWDRSELKGILNLVTSTSGGGKFGCLLGGKSTGKSLILDTLDTSKVFVVNLRKNRNMLTGLISTLKDREFDQKTDFYKNISQVVSKIAGVTSVGLEFDLKKMFNVIMEKPPTHALFQEVILELVDKLGPITIVFDEANLALNIDDKTPTETYLSDLKSTLALFTLLTKEKTKLNILLVSSEYSFPFRLVDPRLSFNFLDLNYFIFAGEVPPNEMYLLLTDKWKIEPDFAKALIDIYGGHIWDVYQALSKLQIKEKYFIPLDPTLITSVQECVDWKGEMPDDNNRMKEALRKLAISGFFPLSKRDDPIAKAMSKFGVGGVVRNDSKVIGLNEQVWKQFPKCRYGIVPSKQSMRLAIIEYLEDEN